MTSRSFADLRPDFGAKAIAWQDECQRQGIMILITCTFRSFVDQNELYKIGRTVKGEGVSAKLPMGRKRTNAIGGQSAHNYGLALDYVPIQHGKLDVSDWSETNPLWAITIAIAQKHGMESLAQDPVFRELAHLQQPNWKDYIS